MRSILYIVAMGRSGTTILEILLRNSGDITGVGELCHILKDGFLSDVSCSCGKKVSACPFWSGVWERLSWKKEDIPSVISLFRSVEWHSRFPLLALRLIPENVLCRYKEVNRRLFHAIKGTIQESVIVDSSKYAGRALALSRCFPGRVRIICLTRSPAGILSSFRNQDAAEQRPKSLVGAVLYYCYVMTCLRAVIAFLGDRVLRVSYEDVTGDINQVLDRIEDWADLDLSGTRKALANDAWLEVGHIVTGNRIRRQGRVKFRPSKGRPEVHGLGARIAVRFMRGYARLLGM